MQLQYLTYIICQKFNYLIKNILFYLINNKNRLWNVLNKIWSGDNFIHFKLYIVIFYLEKPNLVKFIFLNSLICFTWLLILLFFYK